MYKLFVHRIHNKFIIVVLGLILSGCNGLETDISKNLNFPVYLLGDMNSSFARDTLIDIPNHDEMDDFLEYAVYPNPFNINEVSYRIVQVGAANSAQFADIEVSYRNEAMDTLVLFEINDVPVVAGKEKMKAPVSNATLVAISELVNTQTVFAGIFQGVGNTQETEFTLEIFFDTTITIDYDL